MRKRRVYAVVIGVGVLVVLLVWSLSREREPEYGGKKLSEWVDRYAFCAFLPPNLPSNSNSEAADEAADAIRQIGTNGLPYLLKWMRYETPRWVTKLNSMLERINPGLMVSVEQKPPADSAAMAFRTLGRAAVQAIPELSRMLNNPKANDGGVRAEVALEKLGKLGMPALLSVVTNRQAADHVRVSALAYLVINTSDLPMPTVLNLLTDREPQIRIIATNGLREIDPEALEKGTR